MPSSRILPEFDLLLPESVDEAVKMLAEYKDAVTVMAGGTDVIVSATQGFVTDKVMSLAKVPGLSYIKDEADGVKIGAMTTLQDAADSAVIKDKFPALYKSAFINGTPQTRNMGTVAGNILRASPSGDCACALYALGATIVFQSVSGTREVSVDDFFKGYKEINRNADELAIEIKIPAAATKNAFHRINRTTLDLSKINCAVALTMDGDTISAARIAMGAVAATTLRLAKSEALLAGKKVSDDVLAQVADSVAEQIAPIDDVRSTAEYRLDVAGVLLKRTIQEAVA